MNFFFFLHLAVWLVAVIIWSRVSGWPLELVSHFLEAWLLVATLLFWVAVWQYERGFGYSALALVLVFGVKLFAMQNLYPVAWTNEKPATSVTLSQWNVMSRNDLVIHWIEKRPEVDIVVLNEVKPWMKDELKEGLPDYPYKVVPEGWSPDTMIFSRLKLSNVTIAPIEGSPRFLLSAEAEKEGKHFVVMALHTSSPRKPSRYVRRTKEFEAVAKAVKAQTLPVVVVGDLNITAYSPDFTDFMQESGLALTKMPMALPVTWPSFIPIPGIGISIDHVLVSKDVKVFEREASYLVCCSDHTPVVTQFGFADE